MRTPRRWTAKPTIATLLNAGHELSERLVGCWNFNEGGGPSVDDAAIYGPGQLVNSPTWNTLGTTGMALSFNPSSVQFVSIPTNNSIAFGGSGGFGIHLRFSLNSLGLFNGLVSKTSPTTPAPFNVEVSSSGNLQISVGGNGSTSLGFVSGIQVRTWYDVVASYDTTTTVLDIYLNGVRTSSILSTSIRDLHTDIRIGNRNDNLALIDGTVEFVRLWDRPLSGREAEILYTNPYAMMQPPAGRTAFFFPPLTPLYRGTIEANIYAFKAPIAKLVVS